MRVIVKHRVPFIVATEFIRSIHLLAIHKTKLIKVGDSVQTLRGDKYHLAFEKIGDAIYIGGLTWINKITLVDG